MFLWVTAFQLRAQVPSFSAMLSPYHQDRQDKQRQDCVTDISRCIYIHISSYQTNESTLVIVTSDLSPQCQILTRLIDRKQFSAD